MEITCGCYKTKEKSVVSITEVVSHNEYFDYKAKYNGESDEITPARIPDELRDRVRNSLPPFTTFSALLELSASTISLPKEKDKICWK